MAWPIPIFSKSKVNLAGDTLIAEEVDLEALEYAYRVINNWRASHSYPLLNFNVNLRGKIKSVQANALVSQRIKRLESIADKLKRGQTATLKLAQMQDIAGSRVVLRNPLLVKKMVDAYLKSKFSHELKSHKDYIASPKADGYRGHHLVYAYRSKSDKHSVYNGMRVELQIRSDLQHTWATAVEAVGVFTRQALKSNQGSEEWLRFFALVSSAFAAQEKQPLVPNTPTDPVLLKQEILHLAEKLNAIHTLRAYAVTINFAEQPKTKGNHYFLVTLDRDTKRVSIRTFKKKESEDANLEYMIREREAEPINLETVLVSVDSIKALKRAYPNYFMDTNKFMSFLDDYVKS